MRKNKGTPAKAFKSPLNSNSFNDILSSLTAMAIGLLFGYLVLFFANPAQATNGFLALLQGGFTGGLRGVGNVFYYAVPTMMTGLGVAFAFKTGLFNIGGPGQFVVGSYVAILLAVKCEFLPGALRWIVPVVAATLAGALWALIPGLLQAYAQVSIVISTIMMNYIGMYLVNFLVQRTVYDLLRNQTVDIPREAWLPKVGLDKIFPGSSVNINIFIAITVVVIIHIVLNKTTFGYELKACGLNRNASKYAGINEKRNIVLSIMISGAIIGLGGALLYLSGTGKHLRVLDVLAPEGFTGISVALLGMNNPIGVLFSAIFVAYITVGGFYMQIHGFVPEIVDIIISVIIYFSAFSLLIKNFLQQRKVKKETEASAKDFAVSEEDNQNFAEKIPNDNAIEVGGEDNE
jgi:ABC-type uncharacterized transport system, permease component